MDTHRRYVEKDNEAFFLRITRPGDWFYEGADMGILVMRGRMMTDDFRLTERSKKWLAGHPDPVQERGARCKGECRACLEIGGFKMM
jgi:hypothetical protein